MIEKYWYKLFYYFLLDNLDIALRTNEIFKILNSFPKKIFKYFSLYKHQELSFLMNKPIYLGSPYFNTLRFQKEVYLWLNGNLIIRN